MPAIVRPGPAAFAAALLLGAAASACAPDPAVAPRAAAPRPAAATVTASWSSPTAVAYRTPHYLRERNDALYFAENTQEGGVDRIGVYRTPKSGWPGTETLLYGEVAPVGRTLKVRGLTVTYVGGYWYVYFAACLDDAACRIMRVRTGGGAVETMASPSAWKLNALESDGTYLYFTDYAFLRRMPLVGGAMTTLLTYGPGTTWPQPAAIALSKTHVYLANGTAIRRVPRAGGAAETVLTGAAGINRLAAYESITGTRLVYLAAGGEVRMKDVGTAGTTQLAPPVAGQVGTALDLDGARILWGRCQLVEGTSGTFPGAPCELWQYHEGKPLLLRNYLGLVPSVRGDATAVYYASNNSLMRLAY